MGTIEKEHRINMTNGNIIIFRLSDAYCGYNITIQKGYIKDGQVDKTITLSMWDDYGFRAWRKDDNDDIKSIDFEFEPNDPLYNYLLNILGEDEILLIDDDETALENKKIMSLYKNGSDIVISFKNELEDFGTPCMPCDKFYVFIKNIAKDYRSKIDCNNYDTKNRLYKFFQDIKSKYLVL